MALYPYDRYFYRGNISWQQLVLKQLPLYQLPPLFCIQKCLDKGSSPSLHSHSSGFFQYVVPYT